MIKVVLSIMLIFVASWKLIRCRIGLVILLWRSSMEISHWLNLKEHVLKSNLRHLRNILIKYKELMYYPWINLLNKNLKMNQL